MKTLALLIVGLALASSAMAGQEPDSTPAPKPSLAVCKADLKKWSTESVETWTIDQIYEHMTMMQACAETSQKEEKKYKKVMAYLFELYRAHGELGNRALNFIKGHELAEKFREEENGVSPTQSAQKNDVDKH
jgi:hypothetical protein